MTAGTRCRWLLVAGLAAGLVATAAGCRRAAAPPRLSTERIARAGLPAVLTLEGFGRRGRPREQGSGFLLSGSGLGITSLHVLCGNWRTQARLADGRLFSVLGVLAFDPLRDLALFQIGRRMAGRVTVPAGLPHLRLGAAAGLSLGARVVVIGSPEGLAGTVSTGILSGRGNQGELQITAPVSPGSSGGPVFDIRGQVVGVSTFQYLQGEALNFAVSSEAVRRLMTGPWRFLDPRELWRDEVMALMEAGGKGAASGLAISARYNNPGALDVYSGSIRNLSAGTTATGGFALWLGGGSVVGCFGVAPPLLGSGPVRGSRRGGTLALRSIGPIVWRGHIDDERFAGRYSVPGGGALAGQSGAFTTHLVGTIALGPNLCPRR